MSISCLISPPPTYVNKISSNSSPPPFIYVNIMFNFHSPPPTYVNIISSNSSPPLTGRTSLNSGDLRLNTNTLTQYYDMFFYRRNRSERYGGGNCIFLDYLHCTLRQSLRLVLLILLLLHYYTTITSVSILCTAPRVFD